MPRLQFPATDVINEIAAWLSMWRLTLTVLPKTSSEALRGVGHHRSFHPFHQLRFWG